MKPVKQRRVAIVLTEVEALHVEVALRTLLRSAYPRTVSEDGALRSARAKIAEATEVAREAAQSAPSTGSDG